MPYESPDANILKINGQFGSIFATGTILYTGEFFCVQAFTNCSFNRLSASNIENISAFSSGAITLPQGAAIFGNFTGVQLTGGQAFLYKH
jgi:hypothetical protein